MIWESFFAFVAKIFLFTSYVNDKGSFPKPLSFEEERMHLERLANGDMESQEILIRHNLRLVAHIVKKYNNSGIEADDLLSIGSMGLIKAISTYQPIKGTTLATYAARCIGNEILMSLRSNKKHRNILSLYENVSPEGEGSESPRIDILPDKSESISVLVENKIIFEEIKFNMLRVLSDRERQIVSMRFGLDTDRPMTQIEIANKLGICRSYVSRIEKKALKKLKDISENE